MSVDGWYCRIFTRLTPEIRWVTVSDFWLNIYKNMKDSIPVMTLHTSNLSFEKSPDEMNLTHSFTIVIKHTCAQSKIIFATPNQFDIAALKNAIIEEQTRWEHYTSTKEPSISEKFTMDNTGKFIYRPADRLSVVVEGRSIQIIQEGKDTQIIKIDKTYDAYPTLETEDDARWISISSEDGSSRLHCSTIEEMKAFVSLTLHIFSIVNDEPEYVPEL